MSTNDLIILVEQHVEDLDLYADLSNEGHSVEGVTEFVSGRKPKVRIACELQDPKRENRLRSTLAHELGHSVFHNGLDVYLRNPKFTNSPDNRMSYCHLPRDSGQSRVDWMEWQAAYASGAFLMPFTSLRRIAHKFLSDTGLISSPVLGSLESVWLISRVQKAFQVSTDAARVRLLQVDFLYERTASEPRRRIS
jgi:Zn-dependent peptidase ImmA (M78 family)